MMTGLVVTLVLACGDVSTQARTAKAKKHDKVVIGYLFGGRGSGKIDASTVKAAKMTRINYAFFVLKDGVIVDYGQNDADNLAALNALRKDNPAIQIVVSVGGGGAGSAGFSEMAATAEGRAKFVDSAMAMVEKYSLDGIDIDWEYPGYSHTQGVNVRPDDGDHYTALLKELKTRFNKEEKRLHRKLYTSSATGATKVWLDHTNMREASRWLDSINMMCYDWYSAASKATGHDSPLYTNPLDPKQISIDNAVKMYKDAGVPMNKLVVGIPFGGRRWEGVEATNHGLYQPVAGPGPNAPAAPRGGLAVIRTLVNAPGFIRYWDPIAQNASLYNAETKTFIDYQDPEAELARTRYVKDHHLQGIMFWQYTGDPNNVLLDAIDQGFGW
jgi:chitinase